MTHFTLFVLFGLVGENSNLLGLAVFQNGSLNRCALNLRSADFHAIVVRDHNDFVDGDLGVSFTLELLYKNDVSNLNTVLLSASFHNCVHHKAPAFTINSPFTRRRVHPDLYCPEQAAVIL